MLLVCREAAWQANDEIGRTFLGAGPGVYVMTVASLAGLACAIAVAIGRLRQRARNSRSQIGFSTKYIESSRGENQNILGERSSCRASGRCGFYVSAALAISLLYASQHARKRI